MIVVFVITFCIIVALGFGAAAAWSDYNRLIIPNTYVALVGAAFVPAFLITTFFAPDSFFFGSWKNHLFSLGLVFVISYGLFHFKLIGGGDSKFLSVLALWTGMAGLMPLLFVMAVMGGVLGGITLFLNKSQLVKKPVKGSWIAQAQEGKKELPYGVAIFIGAIFAFWHAGYIQPNELMALAVEMTGS